MSSMDSLPTNDSILEPSNSPSHNTLQPSHHFEPVESGMGPKHASLDIVLSNERIILKGVGADVEPAVLAGSVVLTLSEATSIKEITLHFKGKAYLNAYSNDPPVLGSSPNYFSICQHDWSFLEGEKKHSHTLKPGRHIFPFQLRLGGTLPSTIVECARDSASIAYKLRATAFRPGLSTNLSATHPVTLLRSFSAESLEYQQSLEIENTWPEKLMYNLVLPHKAWAAGDDMTCLVKFVPISKGIHVDHVTMSLIEIVKIHCKAGHVEQSRNAVTKRFDIIGGRAVSLEEHRQMLHQAALAHDMSRRQTSTGSTASNASTPGTLSPAGSLLSRQTTNSSDGGSYSPPHQQEPDLGDCNEISTQLSIHIPASQVPTNALDPIVIAYRVRWSIILSNPDGHSSELRCSLPVHILDASLLDDARSATAVTRRLLLGGPDIPEENANDMELPSYPAHVRDRIANAFLPESATVRVTNPWVHNHIDPLAATGYTAPPTNESLATLEASLTHTSISETPVDWAASELVLSLNGVSHPPSSNSEGSPRSSGEHSRLRHFHHFSPSSRSNSPSRTLTGMTSRSSSSSEEHPQTPQVDHHHQASTSSRSSHGLFHISLKPLHSITHAFHHHHHHHRENSQSHSSPNSGTQTPVTRDESPPGRVVLPSTLDPSTGAALLHRAFTEVPTYDVASQGFLGGGAPPIDSLRGLPSYDEVGAS